MSISSLPNLYQLTYATGFIPFWSKTTVLTVIMWESCQWLGKNIMLVLVKINSRKVWIDALAALLELKIHNVKNMKSINESFHCTPPLPLSFRHIREISVYRFSVCQSVCSCFVHIFSTNLAVPMKLHGNTLFHKKKYVHNEFWS